MNTVAQAQNTAVDQQIGIALLAKQLDTAKQQGQAAVQLIEAAAQLNKSLDRGGRLDEVA